MSTIFESLFLKAKNGVPIGLLASGATSTPDFKTWTITLRSGISYTNGQAFNADSAMENLNYLRGAKYLPPATNLWTLGVSVAGFANVVYQPLGFLIFIICAFAETNRAPFDLPECESELVGGYHTEYSSMKLGLFLFAEYINMFISSAVMATLYWGGYNFPFQHELGLEGNTLAILQTVALFAKSVIFIFIFMWVRWTKE